MLSHSPPDPRPLTPAFPTSPRPTLPPSPLILCDRLIALAQEADRAGHLTTATQLLRLAHTVLDEEAAPRHG
jgi:hypothetical protein